MREIRRVITGVNEAGQSVFVRDDVVEAISPPLLGGNSIFTLYGSDEHPIVPNDGSFPDDLRYFPTAQGFRMGIFTHPPKSEQTTYEDFDAAFAETERMSPGLTNIVTDELAMHATSTIDLEYVIAGEFTLTLDSGETKVLKAGDTIVHCGENHKWSNEGTERAVMLVVFIGADSNPSRFRPNG